MEIFDYSQLNSNESDAGIRKVKHFNTECLLTGIWYLENHKCWLTSGKDMAIRQMNIKRYYEEEWDWNKKKINDTIFKFSGHTDLIMHIIEINLPHSIASCSLDKTIRIYNLKERFLITQLKGHQTGIRQMSYVSIFGGFFVSVGYEPHIYVWSPETAIKQAYVGKLKGHPDPVVEAKFLHNSTVLVSIDEKLLIKVFDVYTFECKQTIIPPQ